MQLQMACRERTDHWESSDNVDATGVPGEAK